MVTVGQAGALSRAVDISSASIFAAAGGYSALLLTGVPAAAAVVAATGFAGARLALKQIDRRPGLTLPDFDVHPIEPGEADELPELLLNELAELLLTDRIEAGDELLLEDRLELPSDRSRVIRLFDPRTLPTAGELNERIERHVGKRQAAANADATAELHRALADLRGSMR